MCICTYFRPNEICVPGLNFLKLQMTFKPICVFRFGEHSIRMIISHVSFPLRISHCVKVMKVLCRTYGNVLVGLCGRAEKQAEMCYSYIVEKKKMNIHVCSKLKTVKMNTSLYLKSMITCSDIYVLGKRLFYLLHILGI